MSLTKKIFYNSSAAVINIAGGLLRNKIFAAYLSINLFGILSIGQQAMSVLFTFFAFGLPLGISTFTSALLRDTIDEQRENISRLVILIAILACGSFVVLGVIILVDPYYVSVLIANRADYAIPIGLILLSAPLMVMENCLFAIMEGMGNLKGIVVFKIIPTVVVLPIIFFLITKYFLIGAAIGMVVNEIILICVGLYLLKDQIKLARSSLKIMGVFLSVIKVAVLSFVAGVGWMLTDFVVKRYMLGELGETSNAIIQSVAKITDLYPTVALSWITMHVFPMVSINKDDKNTLIGSLQRTVVVAVAIVIPIILILFSFRELILKILYTSDFTIAFNYFGAMLLVGILKVYSWVLGVALLPLGLKKEWFYSVIITIIVYALSVYYGIVTHLTIYAIPFAHGASLSAQIVYTMFVFRKNEIWLDKTFAIQSMIFFVITVFFVGAVYLSWMLIPAGIVFLLFLIRYKLLHEIAQKITGLDFLR